jgi:uncharacterized protein
MGDNPSAAVHARETHISCLYFTPDRVHKMLKPIRTGFLDHRSVTVRAQALRQEFDLNRRLAPDIYLGLSTLYEEGEAVDTMLTMRRLPDVRRLSGLVRTPEFESALRSVAKSIAAFHSGLDPVTIDTPMADADGLLSLWESSFEEMRPDAGTVLDAAEFAHVETLVHDYLEHATDLFEHRRAAGQVRDGHGDLIAEDIFILPDGPRILDCLAFSADLRISDVLADIAFLVMDIHRLAGVGAAQRLMAWYCEYSGEHHPGSLAHHYVAYRAHIRAKVELLRHRQGIAESAGRAQTYQRLALEHLTRARLRVVMVGGGPGTGKTTLAHAIGQQAGWLVFGSDEERKDLVGLGHETRIDDAPGRGLYDPATTARTYRQLLKHAEAGLRAGASVILDASWADAGNRALAADLAERYGADLIELRCHVPTAEAKRRVTRRRRHERAASDARPEIVDFLEARFDDWPSATVIDTSGALEAAGQHAVTVAWGQCTVRPEGRDLRPWSDDRPSRTVRR